MVRLSVVLRPLSDPAASVGVPGVSPVTSMVIVRPSVPMLPLPSSEETLKSCAPPLSGPAV